MQKVIIKGKVIRGKRYGRKLGYPTVNLDLDSSKASTSDLSPGIYGGIAEVRNVKHVAAISVSPDNEVEAHLLDFSGDLYGEEVVLEVREFISEWVEFDKEVDLISKIEDDIEKVRELNLLS